MEILRQDREDGDTDCDQDYWAQDWPPFIVEGGAVTGSISDLTGMFNLNNLVDATGQADPVALDQFPAVYWKPWSWTLHWLMPLWTGWMLISGLPGLVVLKTIAIRWEPTAYDPTVRLIES